MSDDFRRECNRGNNPDPQTFRTIAFIALLLLFVGGVFSITDDAIGQGVIMILVAFSGFYSVFLKKEDDN